MEPMNASNLPRTSDVSENRFFPKRRPRIWAACDTPRRSRASDSTEAKQVHYRFARTTSKHPDVAFLFPPPQITLSLLLAAALILFCPISAQAVSLSSYDLDSLVFMASDIIEGQILHNDADSPLAEVKISEVHKGNLKAGEIVRVASLSLYQNSYGPDPLSDGQELYFFLVHARTDLGSHVPPNSNIYEPVLSGLKLVRKDKVADFKQCMNPGPYLPDSDYQGRKPLPTSAEFKEQLAASLKEGATLTEQLAAASSPRDIPLLVDLLRTRGKKMQAFRDSPDAPLFIGDAVADETCARLANLHDPESLGKALLMGLPFECIYKLAQGLANPTGREYILSKLEADQEPEKAQCFYALALDFMGSEYQSTFTRINSTGCHNDEAHIPGNGRYLTRIANLAARHLQQRKLCAFLTRVQNPLWFYLHDHRGHNSQDSDVTAALQAIQSLHQAALVEQKNPSTHSSLSAAEDKEYLENIIATSKRSIDQITNADAAK